ncbi:hypothetical protein ACIF9R_08965 [Streptomyces sp. NPDC086080]|uniref:hypothetical protein n=1 Tax=Streptomyces sp. NPDC086080 TaxID=3365748 RepID=UPI0037CCFB66
MRIRGNTLGLTAVSALVVLALTGFSTGRGHGGSSGDGGGCSSSSQNHDSSSGSGGGSHRYDDDDDDEGGTGGGGDAGDAPSSSTVATVDLLTCASKDNPYATVQVTNPHATDGVFTVTVTFEDTSGAEVVTRTQAVAVPAGDTVTTEMNVETVDDVTRIADCDPVPYAPAVG